MSFHKALSTWTLAAGLLFIAGPAHAGWYAKQTHTSGRGSQDSEMYYEDHKLRIDNPDKTSVVVELGTGGFTFIDHGKKLVATATLDELIKLRDEMMGQMRAQLKAAPPEVRTQIEKSLDDQDKAMKSDPKMEKTAKTDKVAGISCQIYTWKAPDGDGEACLADKPGVDMGDFRKDATALGKKLAAMGVGRGATSVPLLQLADYGFPMKNKRTMSMGAQTMEMTTEIKELKSQKVGGDKFTIPADYQKKTFKELMMAGAGGGGGPAPR
ncbi:MAG: DUF4412 domain-containing protein [Deltaproteobacteria bacterium]|jgi:hypothetical protein|nr:DUF4412 domain-containing protein [Deltaproteobacteria bacterium]